MTRDEFQRACDAGSIDRDTVPLLRSLFEDYQGDWDAAHSIAQNIPSVQGSAVHAYLHRKEGDLSNAGYWYRRAGRAMPEIPLAEEWELLAEELTDSAASS
ncbi:MAG: hypothetical protein ACLFP4_01765 [Spirochaetales bacterium]